MEVFCVWGVTFDLRTLCGKIFGIAPKALSRYLAANGTLALQRWREGHVGTQATGHTRVTNSGYPILGHPIYSLHGVMSQLHPSPNHI
jgi:hypothetical protein